MLRPALEVARAAAPLLGKDGRGRLLFLTARSVVEATPELALSSVMRSGVTAAARSLAVELAPDVLVNVVATGQFDTPGLARFEDRPCSVPRAGTRRRYALSMSPGIPVGRLGEARACRRSCLPVLRAGLVRHRDRGPGGRRSGPRVLTPTPSTLHTWLLRGRRLLRQGRRAGWRSTRCSASPSSGRCPTTSSTSPSTRSPRTSAARSPRRF